MIRTLILLKSFYFLLGTSAFAELVLVDSDEHKFLHCLEEIESYPNLVRNNVREMKFSIVTQLAYGNGIRFFVENGISHTDESGKTSFSEKENANVEMASDLLAAKLVTIYHDKIAEKVAILDIKQSPQSIKEGEKAGRDIVSACEVIPGLNDAAFEKLEPFYARLFRE